MHSGMHHDKNMQNCTFGHHHHPELISCVLQQPTFIGSPASQLQCIPILLLGNGQHHAGHANPTEPNAPLRQATDKQTHE